MMSLLYFCTHFLHNSTLIGPKSSITLLSPSKYFKLINLSSCLLSVTKNEPDLLLFAFILLLFAIIIFYLHRPVNIVRDFSHKNPTISQSNNYGYPNGWIAACESQFLKSNTIKRVELCGHKLILLRSSSNDGKIYALDAYCPHLGADLSVGGKLTKNCDSDCVRCPFHGWVFRASDGVCIEVPYTETKKSPPGVKVKIWECLEVNGFIYVWHHAEGLKPNWFPTEIEQIKSNEWKYFGRTEHIVNCLIQEIPENGPDFAHLNEIHAPSLLFGKIKWNFPVDIIKYEWNSFWSKCEAPDEHKARLYISTAIRFFGLKLTQLNLYPVEQIGPAIVNLHLTFKLGFFKLSGCYIQSITPLGQKATKQKIVHRLYLERSWFSSIIAKFLLIGEDKMVERDIKVWSHKIYLDNPKLVKEEKQIASFRRWYSQFFSKSRKLPVEKDLSW